MDGQIWQCDNSAAFQIDFQKTQMQHEHRLYRQTSLACEVDLMSCFARHPKCLHWNHYSATLVVVSYISFCFALQQTDGSKAVNLCQTTPPATAKHSFTFGQDNADKVSGNRINLAVDLHAYKKEFLSVMFDVWAYLVSEQDTVYTFFLLENMTPVNNVWCQ